LLYLDFSGSTTGRRDIGTKGDKHKVKGRIHRQVENSQQTDGFDLLVVGFEVVTDV
jgi:hypothetical protein